MKYLYLLGSVLRSHFDRNRRGFTISVILMFFFSSFLMLFAASVLGSSVLWSESEIDQTDTTYYFYMHEKHSNGTYYDREAVEAGEYIFDMLFSLDSNSIDFISVHIFNDSNSLDKLGKKPIQDIGIMPVLREDRGNKLLFDTWVWNDTLASYKTPYQAEQNIKEGMEITSQQLDNKDRKSWAVARPEAGSRLLEGDGDAYWRREVSALGEPYRAWLSVPENPMFN